MQMILGLVATYGYIVVLLVVMSESAGLPVPGETSLLVASALAATGKLSIAGVIAAAALGAILGDTAGYWVGRRYGLALIRRHGRWLHIDEEKLAKGEAFFARHGEKTVFLGRFVPVGRIFSALLAGVSRMRYQRFLLWNAAGGIAWASLMGALGYLFGTQLPLIERIVQRSGLALLLLILAFLALRYLAPRRKQLRARWARLWHDTQPVQHRIWQQVRRGTTIVRTPSRRRTAVLALVAAAGVALAGLFGILAVTLDLF